MDLFTKTYAELRETFVKARFAEYQHFLRYNIESWLERQRTAELPEMNENGDSPWNYYLSTDRLLFAASGKELDILRMFAAPRMTILEAGPQEYPGMLRRLERITPLLRGLDPRRTLVFYGHIYGPIVLCDTSEPGGDLKTATAFVFDEEHDANGKSIDVLKPLHSIYVMDAVFATWMRGAPRAEMAREFLCHHLGNYVATVRYQAEGDFDHAVAVSTDGLKIVHADEIHVLDRGQRWIRLPETFHERKILRSNNFLRFSGPDYESCLNQFRRHAGADQALFELTSNRLRAAGNRILITDKRFCPDLPSAT